MKYSLKFILFLFLSIPILFTNEAFGASPNSLIKNKPDISVSNFKSIDSLYKNQLKLLDENFFDKFQIIFYRKYKNYLIIDACQGKFSPGNRNGYNMTIVDPEKKIAAYILTLFNKKEEIKIFELQKLNIDFSEQGYIRGRAGENICLSPKEIRKIRSDYLRGNNETGRLTNLTPRTNFDVACGTPEGGDMEFICFEYDKARDQFRDIGGWQNE